MSTLTSCLRRDSIPRNPQALEPTGGGVSKRAAQEGISSPVFHFSESGISRRRCLLSNLCVRTWHGRNQRSEISFSSLLLPSLLSLCFCLRFFSSGEAGRSFRQSGVALLQPIIKNLSREILLCKLICLERAGSWRRRRRRRRR